MNDLAFGVISNDKSVALKETNGQRDGAELVKTEIALMAEQLARLLEKRFGQEDNEIRLSLNFLHFHSKQNLSDNTLENKCSITARCARYRQAPMQLLIKGLELNDLEVQLVMLAGMAQQHEGYADIFRSLHPTSQPYATVALAAQLFCDTDEQRAELSSLLNQSALIQRGLIRLEGDGPIFTRSLLLPSDLWITLITGVASASEMPALNPITSSAGLQCWFDSALVKHCKHCVEQHLNCSVLVFCHDENAALNRAIALAKHCDKTYLIMQLHSVPPAHQLNNLYLSCLMSGSIPILLIDRSEQSKSVSLDCFQSFPGALFICGCTGQLPAIEGRMNINLPIEKLSASSLAQMWQQLLPELVGDSQQLAARFPVEPHRALSVVLGLYNLRQHDHKSIDVEAVAECFKNSTGGDLPDSVELLRPALGWNQLVLPEAQHQQLREAVIRLQLQHKVLDDWQFLGNRRGARGVRLLFSGPPGTGKTLSAEVLAKELNVDLLSVDISRVVSKWVGETEKNLATVFNQAEQMKAVLFFDEADAIFGKRTEVSDSHDRYANLETAYLLSRLEAYDGMAILATNYRNNIDAAFIRRLEYIVDFREPTVHDREKLWCCHVPEHAPLSNDVSFSELASLFPMVGGEIRNAAVSAAYFAAEQQSIINQDHFIRAIRREYEKTGKAFREVKTPLRNSGE